MFIKLTTGSFKMIKQFTNLDVWKCQKLEDGVNDQVLVGLAHGLAQAKGQRNDVEVFVERISEDGFIADL